MLPSQEDTCASSMANRDKLLQIIEEERVAAHFQPIVDLFFGEVISYEVLSRFEAPFTNPAEAFSRAGEWRLSWELESVCHLAALRRIARLPSELRSKKFFLNVTPRVFIDPRFYTEFPINELRRIGMDERQIVFEITETSSIEDYKSFEKLIRRHVDEGFQFALDDFGAGHSSLITLVAASPHYLKLDRGIVSGVHEDPYKQHLVKAIVSFASSVESKLIAEGIEQIEELETVMRLGVRYAQGFLFARPEENPPALSAEMRMQTIQLMRRFHYPRVSVTAPISAIALRPPTLAPNQKTCDEVDSFFRSTPSVDHIVIVDGENPVGLVPKRHFYTIAGGRFGFPLFQRKPVDKIAKMRPLVIEEDIDITVLGKLAMEREQEDLYDPVVVTDASGRFVGTVTMKRLLSQSIRLELQMATNANPLTGLPGNALIEQWLQEAIDVAKYSIVYADLDRFKEYNDSYGFPQGDAMIKLTAKILSERVGELCADARLGHVGGDDFVIVAKSIIKPDPLQRICDAFDVEKAELFNMQDVRKGSYIAMDRQGNRENVPLVTLSLSALTSDIVGPIPHAGQLGQFAASLKKHVKARNREHGSSGFLFERRRRPGMEGIEAC